MVLTRRLTSSPLDSTGKRGVVSSMGNCPAVVGDLQAPKKKKKKGPLPPPSAFPSLSLRPSCTSLWDRDLVGVLDVPQGLRYILSAGGEWAALWRYLADRVASAVSSCRNHAATHGEFPLLIRQLLRGLNRFYECHSHFPRPWADFPAQETTDQPTDQAITDTNLGHAPLRRGGFSFLFSLLYSLVSTSYQSHRQPQLD